MSNVTLYGESEFCIRKELALRRECGFQGANESFAAGDRRGSVFPWKRVEGRTGEFGTDK